MSAINYGYILYFTRHLFFFSPRKHTDNQLFILSFSLLPLSFQLSAINYGYSLKSVKTKQIYEESLYLSFKEFHSIKTRDEKIEDNFRALKQELQQEAEALSNASTEIMSERFEKLKKGQVDRSNDVKVRSYLRHLTR